MNSNLQHLELRRTFSKFPTGVAVVTMLDPVTQNPFGMTLSSFNSVSLDPALIAWSLSKHSHLVPLIQQRIPYRMHILSTEQEHLVRKFASGPQEERFLGVEWLRDGDYIILDPEHTLAWFECTHEQVIEAGDHFLLLSHVQSHGHTEKSPMLFFNSKIFSKDIENENHL